MEPDLPLPDDVTAEVLQGGEVAIAQTGGNADRAIFCAKEAAYKCLYPITHEVIGFDAMTVSFPAQNRFCAMLLRETGPFPKGFVLNGTVLRAASRIVSMVWLDASQPR